MPQAINHRKHWTIFLFVWVGLTGIIRLHVWGLDDLIQHQYQSRDIFTSARSTLDDMIDIETGLRGYLVTAKKEYLRPYHEGLGRLVADSAALQARVDEDTIDSAAYRAADGLIRQVLAEFATQIDLMDSQGKMAAQKRFDDVPTKPIMDRIRVQIATIYAEEAKRLDASRIKVDRIITTISTLQTATMIATIAIALSLATSLLPSPGGD